MAGHADIESQFAERMAGIVLHALDVLVLAECMPVVGEHRDDGCGQHERQHHGDHEFDEAQSALAPGQAHFRSAVHGATTSDR